MEWKKKRACNVIPLFSSTYISPEDSRLLGFVIEYRSWICRRILVSRRGYFYKDCALVNSERNAFGVLNVDKITEALATTTTISLDLDTKAAEA
jgi:hypothetical protein